MYACPTAPYVEYLEKELVEYNFDLHRNIGVDPQGKLKKWIGREYTHRPHIEEFWVNCDDDKELQM